MANRIPRTATKLEVTFLLDSSVGKSGIKMVAEKTVHGWVGERDGQVYYLIVSHLRNENFCSIKILE